MQEDQGEAAAKDKAAPASAASSLAHHEPGHRTTSSDQPAAQPTTDPTARAASHAAPQVRIFCDCCPSGCVEVAQTKSSASSSCEALAVVLSTARCQSHEHDAVTRQAPGKASRACSWYLTAQASSGAAAAAAAASCAHYLSYAVQPAADAASNNGEAAAAEDVCAPAAQARHVPQR